MVNPTGGGGTASIAARSSATRSIGRAWSERTVGLFAVGSHRTSCSLKSATEVKLRLGRNEVSKN